VIPGLTWCFAGSAGRRSGYIKVSGIGVLGTPSPSVTPTNLLYNVVATPGALYRYWRQGQTGGRLALVLIAGTLPA
jgi:uncharacterized membrane protein YfcA